MVVAGRKGFITWIFCLQLALLVLLHVALGDEAGKKRLCEDEEHVKISRLDDLRYITPEGCPPEVEDAFLDLLKMAEDWTLVNFVTKFRFCTLERSTRITDFFETHIRRPKEKGTYKELPKALVDFAVAYGMLVSSNCKYWSFTALSDEYSPAVSERENRALEKFIGPQTKIGRLLDSTIEPMEFVTPSQFETLIPGFESHYMPELLTLAQDKDDLYLVQWACTYRFVTSIATFIDPVAQLVNNGFNYFSEKHQSRLYEMPEKTRKRVKFWSKVVFLCEAIKKTEQLELMGAIFECDSRKISFYPAIGAGCDLFKRDSLVEAVKSYDATISPEERFGQMLLERKFFLAMGALKTNESSIDAVKKLLGKYEYANSDGTKKDDTAMELVKNELIRMLEEGETNFVRVITQLATGSRDGLIEIFQEAKISIKFALKVLWELVK